MGFAIKLLQKCFPSVAIYNHAIACDDAMSHLSIFFEILTNLFVLSRSDCKKNLFNNALVFYARS